MKHLFKSAAEGLSAAEVIARRMPTLWMLPFLPTHGAQAETVRMVTEKQAALAEGLAAVWFKAMTGTLKASDLARAQDRVHTAAMAPAGRRLRANVKRLRKP
jgi:hypothetical protein